MAVAAAARLHDGPLGPLPGGRFRSGEPVEAREIDWAFAQTRREIELELRPAAPRSVRTWFVVMDGELYVSADFIDPWKRWPFDALADPRLRVRVAGRILERRAVRVDDPGTIAALRGAFARKYDLAPDGLAARVEVWFFRMDPR